MKFHFIGILLFLISALGFTLHSGQIPPYPYIKAVLLNIMVGATNVQLRYCSNINLQFIIGILFGGGHPGLRLA